MVEQDWPLTEQKKQELRHQVMEEKRLPDFGREVERVSYLDGCKVYFREGWVILRFSGTEPRVRIFAEGKDREEAETLVGQMASFAGLPFQKT